MGFELVSLEDFEIESALRISPERKVFSTAYKKES